MELENVLAFGVLSWKLKESIQLSINGMGSLCISFSFNVESRRKEIN